jgi:hypothetical protein
MDEFDTHISWDNCLKDCHDDASELAPVSSILSFEMTFYVHFHFFFDKEHVMQNSFTS